MISCPTVIEILDTKTLAVYRTDGTYYGNGRITTNLEGIPLEIDPDIFHDSDPKMFFRSDKNKWTRYRLKSSILNSKAILKEEKIKS